MTYPMGAVTLKTRATPAVNAQRKSLAPPAWVATLLEGSAAQKASAVGPIRLQLHSGSYFTLVSARVPDVSTPARLESGTRNAYLAIRDVLSSLGPRHPVRFWNHISDITAATAIQGKNRYMAFNAGRFQAMTDWFGGIDHFDTAVPTASGIGHGGRGLIVHCLAARRPGRAISNPRQVQPHRYSALAHFLPVSPGPLFWLPKPACCRARSCSWAEPPASAARNPFTWPISSANSPKPWSIFAVSWPRQKTPFPLATAMAAAPICSIVSAIFACTIPDWPIPGRSEP